MRRVFPFSIIALLSLVQGQDSIFDNDLAKVCRPLDRSLDLLFVLDGSGSTGGNTFETQKNMVQRIIDLVDISPNKTKIAILQYSGYTRMEWDFAEFQTKEELKAALENVRHISGTTKTGKALEKAMESFSREFGARMNDPNIAQVAIVVSDGHSHDDPIPGADALREMGVTLMAVGIGDYVNMNELVDIAADAHLAFRNDSIDEFVSAFSKIAIGEQCEFAKGQNGAEIRCMDDRIDVEILTKHPLGGHLYVPRFFGFQGCTALASEENPNSFNPRGLLFETSVILKFHPEYHTQQDKTFPVRCFYPDHRNKETLSNADSSFKQTETRVVESFSLDEFSREDGSQNDLPLISSFSVPEMELPCSYNLRRSYENNCLLENLNVGDVATHMWTCDKASIGEHYGMLVHSCYMTDGLGKELEILDINGCSLDKVVMPTPTYLSFLEATTQGGVVKYADHPMMQFRCSIKFCNKLIGECDSVLPPRCENVTEGVRTKRQVLAPPPPAPHAPRLPPHFMERLFARRKFFEEEAAAKLRDIRRESVDAHAVVQSDSTQEPALTSDGIIVAQENHFPTDDSGLPALQTLVPMVKIQPVSRRPMPKQRNLRPAYPRDKTTSDFTTAEVTTQSIPESTTPVSTEAWSSGSHLPTHDKFSAPLLTSTLGQQQLKIEDSDSEGVTAHRGLLGTESDIPDLFSTERFETEDQGWANQGWTSENPRTEGTTPWHWVQVNGRWVREGIWPTTETTKTEEKIPEWVYVNGQWVRQEFAVDDSSWSEIQMFEEMHKVEQPAANTGRESSVDEKSGFSEETGFHSVQGERETGGPVQSGFPSESGFLGDHAGSLNSNLGVAGSQAETAFQGAKGLQEDNNFQGDHGFHAAADLQSQASLKETPEEKVENIQVEGSGQEIQEFIEQKGTTIKLSEPAEKLPTPSRAPTVESTESSGVSDLGTSSLPLASTEVSFPAEKAQEAPVSVDRPVSNAGEPSNFEFPSSSGSATPNAETYVPTSSVDKWEESTHLPTEPTLRAFEEIPVIGSDSTSGSSVIAEGEATNIPLTSRPTEADLKAVEQSTAYSSQTTREPEIHPQETVISASPGLVHQNGPNQAQTFEYESYVDPGNSVFEGEDWNSIPIHGDILPEAPSLPGEISGDSLERMDLQGLSRRIQEGLHFGEVELESQIVMVHDREEVLERGRSLVNWCPRR